jgi:hypothetical protein
MTHLGASYTDLDQVRVVGLDFGVDASNVLSEDVCDVSRVDSFQDQLDRRQLNFVGCSRLRLTPTASPRRILTFCFKIKGFMKHLSSVAIAMTAGMATKLKTL